MKNLAVTFVLTISLCLIATKSLAWGQKGHALVAEVAFQYLDATTKKNVLQYLNGMTIEDAANWMDAIKSDHSYDYMKKLHYLDLEKGSKEAPAGENIATALLATLKDLNNIKSLTNDEVKMRLFYLFHLIGDIHQPLHVGYPSDKGGNTFQTTLNGRPTNLHSIWDSGIIETKNITLADVLKSNTYTSDELLAVKKIDVIGWAKQSRGYLKNVYNVKDDKINDFYVDANAKIIEKQILDAGLRLAAVLEFYFKDSVYQS